MWCHNHRCIPMKTFTSSLDGWSRRRRRPSWIGWKTAGSCWTWRRIGSHRWSRWARRAKWTGRSNWGQSPPIATISSTRHRPASMSEGTWRCSPRCVNSGATSRKSMRTGPSTTESMRRHWCHCGSTSFSCRPLPPFLSSRRHYQLLRHGCWVFWKRPHRRVRVNRRNSRWILPALRRLCQTEKHPAPPCSSHRWCRLHLPILPYVLLHDLLPAPGTWIPNHWDASTL